MPLSRSVMRLHERYRSALSLRVTHTSAPPHNKQTKSWFTFGDTMGSVEGRSGFTLGAPFFSKQMKAWFTFGDTMGGGVEIGDWGAALLQFRGRAKPCSLEDGT